MQEYVGLLIAAARRRIKQAVLARVAEHRLKPHEFWLLVALAEHPGISQAALAQRTRADAPTVSRTLAALCARRLVRTEFDPDDRRRSRVYLTAGGERLCEALTPLARRIRSTIEAGLSPTELSALRNGLRRVIENIDSLEADASAQERR